MTDRELLELAAKAAGLEYHWVKVDGGSLMQASEPGSRSEESWNPLTDDGDALRLAVKLNLHLGIEAESAGAITIEWGMDGGGKDCGFVLEAAPIGGNDYAATRRAIVRAAARIGKTHSD